MAYDVDISRLPHRAVFDLKGARNAVGAWCGPALPPFPDHPNRLSELGDQRLFHIGPDHWLLTAPLAEEEHLSASLRPDRSPADVCITLLSDTLVFFAVTGREAGDVLAVATPLDLHPSAFPPGGASWTEAFGTKTLIRRVAGGYEIAVDASYGDWFEAALTNVSA